MMWSRETTLWSCSSFLFFYKLLLPVIQVSNFWKSPGLYFSANVFIASGLYNFCCGVVWCCWYRALWKDSTNLSIVDSGKKSNVLSIMWNKCNWKKREENGKENSLHAITLHVCKLLFHLGQASLKVVALFCLLSVQLVKFYRHFLLGGLPFIIFLVYTNSQERMVLQDVADRKNINGLREKCMSELSLPSCVPSYPW